MISRYAITPFCEWIPQAADALQPGINEVTISGLTPTLDEDSVKVEGAGSAIITDISVVSLPNHERFEDVYPEEDESDADESDEEVDVDSAELLEAQNALHKIKDEMTLVDDVIASSDKRLLILSVRTESADKSEEDKPDRLTALLDRYKTERLEISKERLEAVQQKRLLDQRIEIATRKLHKIYKAAEKAKRELAKAKQKALEAEKKKRRESRAERERNRMEKLKFWPKYCYSVTVTLDVNTMTPISSRRQSVSSDVDVVRPIVASAGEAEDDEPFQDCISCSLSLSYVTSAAKWLPSYDLQLSTTGATATLCFDAKIFNLTSESWKNCKVSLSTSNNAFSGIDSALPELTPWRIRLAARGSNTVGRDDVITRSSNEVSELRSYIFQTKNRTVESKPRNKMFGVQPQQNRGVSKKMKDCIQDDEVQPDPDVADLFQGETMLRRLRRSAAAPAADSMFVAQPYSAPTPGAVEDKIDFEDSFIEEAGMTMSYDLPGLKTLVPKMTSSKQRVARITFSNVTLSHTVIAKYRPVAYLQAKLKNNSKLTLLEGRAGLTLDGSFMGHTTIPRCSSGDMFHLSLGIDPAIKVSYPKPEVRRATTGLFNKEDSSVFARVIILHNTRAASGKAAQLQVQDQVPVSEDERLRVDVVTPRGLAVAEGSVIAGAPGREEDNRDRDWGNATALMKKGGEVTWDVKLNASKMVKLWLEYSVAVPSGDSAVEC